MSVEFIHIPKTGGTSIREGLGFPTKFYHKRLKDYEEIPRRSFTVVRNPYDRAVSLCAHVLGKEVITPELFQEWCYKNEDIRLYKKYNVCLADPMMDFVAVNGTMFVTDTLRFETLEQDIYKLFKKNLPHLNKGNREEYKQYYNDESFNLITEKYKADIETFNYEF